MFDNNIERLASNVEIPDSFYKIVVDKKEDTPRAPAFIIPQDIPSEAQFADYLTTIDEIETLTDLDFFWELEDTIEAQLEAAVETLWETRVATHSISSCFVWVEFHQKGGSSLANEQSRFSTPSFLGGSRCFSRSLGPLQTYTPERT